MRTCVRDERRIGIHPSPASTASAEPPACPSIRGCARPFGLTEALQILELIADQEPERFDRAAVRWLGRLALERKGLALPELSHAIRALEELPEPGAKRHLLALA